MEASTLMNSSFVNTWARHTLPTIILYYINEADIEDWWRKWYCWPVSAWHDKKTNEFLKQFLQLVLYKTFLSSASLRDLSDRRRHSSAVPYANFLLCCFFCPPSPNLFNHQVLPGPVQRGTCQAKSHARTTPTRSQTQICWDWLNVFVPGGTGPIQAFPSLLILQICNQKKQHEYWPGYCINILFSWWG